MNDKQLDDLINGLADEVAPERDLWPDIEARLAQPAASMPAHRPAPGRWWGQLALAAAVLVSVAAGAWWSQTPVEAPAAVALADLSDDAIADAADTGWRGELQTADDTLAAALDERRGTMEPELLLIIEQNLTIIDDAMADIDAAMDAAPDDPTLRAALIDAWRQRIGLMERARALTDS